MARQTASPVIVIAANAAWNLVNFRSGLITALVEHGYDVVGAAPPDARAEDGLRALGARFAPVPIDSKGVSPVRDLRTARAFRALFRRERPVCMLGYTVKPNVYGSVAARDIIDALGSDGAKIGKNQVVLDRPIKTLGMHEVRVALHAEVVVTIKINVARSPEEAELQAQGVDVSQDMFERDAAGFTEDYDPNAEPGVSEDRPYREDAQPNV